MIKIFLPLIVILGLISCNSTNESADYMETWPDSEPVIFAPDVVSIKGRFEHGISFTPDVKELAFGILNKDDFSGEIYYSKKVDNIWTEPMLFEPLKNECVYLPYFSPDGKSMLYAKSNSDTNNGFTDIWMLKRNSDNWSEPTKVNSLISTLSRESTACMSLDNTIYFSSNRGGNGLADLYCSPLQNAEYLTVKRINSICSVRDEESIFISPDENYVIFSRYATNENGPDLFISYQDSKSNWIKPTLLDSTINSKDWERRPFVSIDNKYLFFTRLHMGEKGLIESDIYWVNTSKLFKPFVYNSLPDTVVHLGEKFELSIPADYFKDIDDNQLVLSVNKNEIDWIEFDSAKMKLSGLPTLEGDYELTFTAVDNYLNKTLDKIKMKVIK